MENSMNSPYARESFASDFWKGKTAEGLTESVEYLTRYKVYFSDKWEKKFCRKALLRPEKVTVDASQQD